MTRFTIAPRHIDMWLHQNAAETLDCVEGCLLDSFIVGTKNGYAAIYEHYLNANSSDYLVEFERGDAPNVWTGWEEFAEKNREEDEIA